MPFEIIIRAGSTGEFRSLFSVSFHPNVYYPSWPMQCILADRTHVLRPKVLYRTESQPRKGLWLRINANSIGAKAVVRRWATRRVQQAVRAELAAKGLDIDGAGTGKERNRINGTMEVVVRQPSLKAEWHYLKAEMGRIIDAVIQAAEVQRNVVRRVG